jgi:hypothetical protein
MAPRILYLFPDTSVFVQCRPLEELWSDTWKGFDEVHLIVSRPVQSEIDNQKNRGDDRLGRRARAASSALREVILGSVGHKVIRDSGTCVKLLVQQELKPNPDLSMRLDYQERDDQLVGIVHAFVEENPDADTRLLTHDTGPMASAKMVGVRVEPVPDAWLLPPENTSADKRIKADGVRPAKDALVAIEAKGRFKIMPPARLKTDDEEKPLTLPPPPRAPHGKWKLSGGPLERFEAAQRAFASLRLPPPISIPDFPAQAPKRDPNAFYWKPRCPEIPISKFILECEQWRHGVEAQLFTVELYFDKAQEAIEGALECRIHAANLSDISELRVPVRIGVKTVRGYEVANAMVDRLTRP